MKSNMRTFVFFATVFSTNLFMTLSTYACDENCRKKKASTENNIKFSGYLNRKYCSDLTKDFMTASLKSLQSYRANQLGTKHRGGMRNTSRYLKQRLDWLTECDRYLTLTNYGRVFKENQTTDDILTAIESVNKELDSLVAGVTYTNETGDSSTLVAAEKFDHLFKLIDSHKTMLLLKGQFVVR